jgi:hypothetical protein
MFSYPWLTIGSILTLGVGFVVWRACSNLDRLAAAADEDEGDYGSPFLLLLCSILSSGVIGFAATWAEGFRWLCLLSVVVFPILCFVGMLLCSLAKKAVTIISRKQEVAN